MRRIVSILGIIVLGMAAACQSPPRTVEKRERLEDRAQAALNDMQSRDPDLNGVLNNSAAYAIFPNVGEGAAGVGGAYGHGILYQRGQQVGWVELTQASIGAQLGGRKLTELVVFQDQTALDRLRAGKLQFGADASAVALRRGVARDIQFREGVAVIILAEEGLMASANVSGQRIAYQPMNSTDRMATERQ